MDAYTDTCRQEHALPAPPACPARLPGPPACRPACPPACRPAGLLACPGTDPDGEGRWARQESGRGRDEIG